MNFYESGEEINISHTFSNRGVFRIKARAKDINGVIGKWSMLQLSISKSIQQSSILAFFQILQRLLNIR